MLTIKLMLYIYIYIYIYIYVCVCVCVCVNENKVDIFGWSKKMMKNNGTVDMLKTQRIQFRIFLSYLLKKVIFNK